jgi:hypothetical protein
VELAGLREALSQNSPAILHVNGMSGIGKSALQAAFAEEARAGVYRSMFDAFSQDLLFARDPMTTKTTSAAHSAQTRPIYTYS